MNPHMGRKHFKVPNPLTLHFRDSYWVIKGLLTCEMYTTVKGMLENLLEFIDKYILQFCFTYSLSVGKN